MSEEEVQVGDVVDIRFVGDLLRVRVIEDRGHLGVGGRRILRIQTLPGDPDTEPREFEIPASSVLKVA